MDCSQCQEQMSIYKFLSFNLTVMDFRIIIGILTVLSLICIYLTYKFYIRKLRLEEYKINSENPTYCVAHKKFMVYSHETKSAIYAKCPIEGCDRVYKHHKSDGRKILYKVDLNNPYS